jgi:hypothetical protein
MGTLHQFPSETTGRSHNAYDEDEIKARQELYAIILKYNHTKDQTHLWYTTPHQSLNGLTPYSFVAAGRSRLLRRLLGI